MKENKYDDDGFFKAYSAFPRSVQGLNAAGEWHELKALLPDFTEKRVLDIGCGFGWHCTYAAEQGASYVLGTDISEKMLSIAKARTAFGNVEYRQIAMEDISFPANSFDAIISSLAFHYTPDFPEICQRIHRYLTAGGDLVFSVEHPIFTAHGSQDWIYDEKHTPSHWPVDHYFSEGKRDTVFLEEKVIKYHRTLTTYLDTLLEAGFTIAGIREPKPAPHLLETVPEMQNELRRPMMLIISAKKICAEII